MQQILTIENLWIEVARFADIESVHNESSLYAVIDGKAVETYLEDKVIAYLEDQKYDDQAGNSASGIDLPTLEVDIKVTSIRQLQ